ncbi:MAG: molybdate ABC transporter substrate-binding protein [Planctomycetes bacterium]|nr:molybdate ABC transporter substrate-binding protein [Planctomycetota bacterium]
MRSPLHRSRGAVSLAVLAIVSAAILAICVVLLRFNAVRETDGGDADVLTVYCAAGLRPAMEAVRRSYEAEYGVRVDVNFGGSGSLLGTIRGAAAGDLYIAADMAYLDRAGQLGLCAEVLPLAWQNPVVAVADGNPKGIRGFKDLLRDDVQVGMANPEAAAVGKCVRTELREAGLWNRLKARLAVMKMTVNEVANDVKMGAIDAGITWDATLTSYPELEAVVMPELVGGERQIACGLLTSSEVPTSALRFARYLTARDRGLLEFEKRGFRVIDGDQWVEIPRLILMSGAMLRPGIEDVIVAFQRREGCELEATFNGCGVLVSQMKAGSWPDAYLSCDRSFMEQVRGGFQEPRDLSENDMVILVQQGNPRGIRGLIDLREDGLRVGLADATKSALGALTERMLKRAGLAAAVNAGVELRSPTGDMLVNQMLLGSLDAAVVYRSNALAHEENRDRLDVVEVKVEGATASQSYAVARETDHPWLLGRFFDRVRNKSTRGVFESVGFRWIGR